MPSRGPSQVREGSSLMCTSSVEDGHLKIKSCPSPYHAMNECAASLTNQVGAGQKHWALCLCPRGPNIFSNSWISFKTSGSMPLTEY